MLVYAKTINFTIGTQKLHAETDVRSSVQPSRGEPAKGAPPAQGKGRGATQDSAKMPSMLEQDQPVSATSAKMDYDGAAGVATYTGQAKLWQEKTQVQGDVIVVDDKSGNLTARGHVRSVMFFDEIDTEDQEDASRADDSHRRHDDLRGGHAGWRPTPPGPPPRRISSAARATSPPIGLSCS